MKRRITFLYDPNSTFDPKQLQVEKKSVQITSLQAAREERWTTNLYDLPQELWLALKQLHELHIRWAPAAPQPSIAPFISAVSPGLHVSLSPQKDSSANRFCPLFSKVFGGNLNCTSAEDTFTRTAIMAERFASSASLQYYEYQPSIINLVKYIQEKICLKQDNRNCRTTAGALTEADHVDIDYDTISQSLHLRAFWHAPPIEPAWNEQITQPKGQSKVEIGILAPQTATRPEEISLGGYLITLGEDSKPNPTLFSFPSRHHAFTQNYTTTFTTPTGLHPTLRLTFPPSLSSSPPLPSCALHTYLTLPATLFPDKYQLSQPNLLKANNLAALRSLSPPAPDLEAPFWTTKEWGSALLIELSPPLSSSSGIPLSEEWHADIPLHTRYLGPSISSTHSHSSTTIPNPPVFWACPSSNHDEAPSFDTNPFDRRDLGYDGLFGERTVFYHLNMGVNHEGRAVQVLDVPVLDGRWAGLVEWGTGVVVLVGVGWVVWCLLGVVLWGAGREGAKETGEGRGRKKVE